MTHHTCKDCQVGFVATSQAEAEEEAKKTKPAEEIDFEDLTYAKFCPYCGSLDVEAV